MKKQQKQTHIQQMRQYYGNDISKKWGEDYEEKRWTRSLYFRSQYRITKKSLDRALNSIIWDSAFELGPGPGTWTKLLLEKNSNSSYTLVDISEYMKKQFVERFGEQKNISYVLSDFESYDTESKTYDLFFSVRAIDYISDKEKMVSSISSLLKHGGNGIIVAKMGHPMKKKVLGQKTPWQHTHKIGPQKLIQLLKKHNCKIKYARPVMIHIPIVGRIAGVNELFWHLIRWIPLGWWNRWLCESYIVTFSKL